jgi:hypothetical protein
VAPWPTRLAAVRLTVCDYDSRLHFGKRPVFHVLSAQPTPSEALDALERPEDCTIACYRRGGTEPCVCDDEHEDGTTAAPGGW